MNLRPSSSTLSFGRAPGAAGRTDVLRKATTRKEGEPCGTETAFYLAAAGPLASSPPIARRDPLSSRARYDHSTPSREDRDPRQGTSAYPVSQAGTSAAHDTHAPSAGTRLCAHEKTGCSCSAHGHQRGSASRCVQRCRSPELKWSRLVQSQGPQDPRRSSLAERSHGAEPRLALPQPARSEKPDARHVRSGALPDAHRAGGVTDDPRMEALRPRGCHNRAARIRAALARPPARMRDP
jgi:hypothetical protein